MELRSCSQDRSTAKVSREPSGRRWEAGSPMKAANLGLLVCVWSKSSDMEDLLSMVRGAYIDVGQSIGTV
jgi:hypothetical protein